MRRLEVCVPASEAAVIRKAVSVLRERTKEAGRLRSLLGFASEISGNATAIDVFAMPDAMSPKGEAGWDEVMKQIERDRRNPALNRARKVAL